MRTIPSKSFEKILVIAIGLKSDIYSRVFFFSIIDVTSTFQAAGQRHLRKIKLNMIVNGMAQVDDNDLMAGRNGLSG